MRKTFARNLHYIMSLDPRLVLLTADLGYMMWDEIKRDFGSRMINCGASEQAMLDIAVGLAYDGKIPVCYSISPFLILRGLETIRTYINHEKLHVILVGSGRDDDYIRDGISHDASDIGYFLNGMSNIYSYWPEKKEEVAGIFKECIDRKLPSFISLRRDHA